MEPQHQVDAVLSPDEERVMKQTFYAAVVRCADICEKITEDDVLEMQRALLGSGSTLQQVARLDRLTIAVAHLRSIAEDHKP